MTYITLGSVTFGPTKSAAETKLWRDMQDPIHSISLTGEATQMCNCIGPQAGEKLCPCALAAEARKGAEMVANGVTVNGVKYRLVPA